MFKNYWKIAFRNMIKQKVYSFINILGLLIGMTICILIFLWVHDELKYDRFHEHTREIFRVTSAEKTPRGEEAPSLSTPIALGPELQASYPEITLSTRCVIYPFQIGTEKRSFAENMALVDPSFLQMFSFPLVKGDFQSALQNPNSIVLTESIANKYFGDNDPIGQTIKINNQAVFSITGVIKNIPSHSHLQFDGVINIALLKSFGTNMEDWGSFSYWTYVQLRKDADYKDVDKKITNIIQEKTHSSGDVIHLQPITKIHLYDLGGGGLIVYIYIFSAMAVFILLIACINYMNLSTARFTSRAKEVSIRKVVGANRLLLGRQFLSESMMMSLIAILAALLLVYCLIPSFNQISGKQLTFNFSSFVVLFIIGIALLTGFISGCYPAFVLSAMKPVYLLKGGSTSMRTGSWFRRILVMIQFSLSILLIIGTVCIYKQLSLIRNKDLGYNGKNIVCLNNDLQLRDNYWTFKNALLDNKNIVSVTISNATPEAKMSSISGRLIRWDGKQEDNQLRTIHLMGVDYDFLKTYQLHMVEGRFFNQEYSTDWDESAVLNEAAVRAMGIESPVGKRLYWGDQSLKIIGIVKNFHFRSLHHELEPLLIKMGWSLIRISIRISPDNIPSTLPFIEKTYKEIIPGSSLLYEFFEDKLDGQYQAEKRLQSIINYMAFLAIFISCLGVLGLASFTAEQRTKEIGIRRVLGASVSSILSLLSKGFVIWIMLANIISWPIAYYVINKWLQNFAYRIDLSVWTFILSGLAALAIALLIVSYQSIKAATANPVDSLRYE